MSSFASTTSTGVFRKAGLRDTAVLLALAWLVPFVVHLVPWSGPRPLGAYLLPMFWTAFVAVYFYGVWIGLLAGLFAPAINLALTGMPANQFILESSFELIVFAGVAASLIRAFPRFVLIGPGGYVLSRGIWALLQLALGTASAQGVGEILLQSLRNGFAGLIVLAAINAALVWFYPKK